EATPQTKPASLTSVRVDHQDQGFTGDPGDEWWEDVDGERMRGWIPPDDRLWRHPSESGARPPASRTPPAVRSDRRAGPRPWVAGTAVVCAVVALVATGLTVMTTSASDPGDGTDPGRMATLTGAPTTEPGAGRMSRASIDDMVSNARPSLVALSVEGAGATAVGTGLVVE